MDRTAARIEDATARLLAGYRPLPGTIDELVDEHGVMRPVWQPLAAAFAAMSDDDRLARFARGAQYLRDAGVFFRQYGEKTSTERDWPLSPVPVILSDVEWAGIETALTQRADLLEGVMADLYGPGRLVADGLLPAAVVARNGEWLRPLVGVSPRGGHFLHFIAFDIARNLDGSWFVLGDRTQAPSGAGFALENRVATSRVFPELFQRAKVHRLAGFFRQFRDALQGLRRVEGNRIGILTPGPLNDTYFEHAYIARYLGFSLLEGEDLTVQDGQAMVRTVEGLRPVDVLWRRLDSAFADPLELEGRSRIGTPGLISALRAGNLTMVNALGSGLLETRAFLAFLPRISQHLQGRPLMMPNIATWWCGQAKERAHVQANMARLTVAPAFGGRLPFEAAYPSVPGDSDLPIGDWLARDAEGVVGQERVRLSTTPVWAEGGLVPRPMSLRVFLARTPQGWAVMKGGYARIGRSDDPTAVAVQMGGSVADVWVRGDAPVPHDSMVDGRTAKARPFRSALPARAADNLFWLGRYVERTETAARHLRAWHLRFAEGGTADTPLLTALSHHLEILGVDPQGDFASELADRIDRALACASRLRDRFSGDGWQALNDLSQLAHGMAGADHGDDAARASGALLRRVAGLAGLVHENMYRSVGWRFLTIGRALERADAMAAVLHRFAAPDAPDGSLDLAIELGDSIMTHRRRFPVGIGRDSVIDLLAMDDENPRSILWQLGELRDQIARLPGDAREGGPMEELPRAVLLAHTSLAVCAPAEVDGTALHDLRQALSDMSDPCDTAVSGVTVYDITARIRYDYDPPATAGHNILRLMPADIPGRQRLILGQIAASPDPAERGERMDFFGNRVAEINFRKPAATTAFTLRARVDRLVEPGGRLDLSPPLDGLAAQIDDLHSLAPAAPTHFLGPSARIAPSEEIAAFARKAIARANSTRRVVTALGRALHAAMTFDATATTVDTTPAEAFRLRRGVCQDLAHVMIAGLRSLGVPAGYVSGYLRTLPPKGQPRLEGADAMHAWVRAWCGRETGWLEYDPTNACPAGTGHVIVAYGRDYDDVCPVQGILRLSGAQRSSQSVDTRPLSDE